jgi:RNA polymerase sigma-70 factor, ECF subfamily
MDESESDEDLMLRYRAGDARAFATLYERHKGPLFRYFSRLARPPAVVEELFQDVWTNVICSRERYEIRAKFSTWLYRLAHNRLVDHYRRVSAGVPLADNDAADSILDQVAEDAIREPDSELERRRLGKRLMQALDTLPDAQREVFLLREESGLSLEEIAAVIGIDLEAAKSRLRYALAKLRRALASEANTNRARVQD